MRVCPNCQTKNEDSSNFCKECGAQLSGSQFQEKKEKVLAGKKAKFPWLLLSLVIVAIALTGIAYWLVQEKTTVNPKIASQKRVLEGVNYAGQTIRMTDIRAKVEDGRISIPLDVVMEKKMVRFEYEGNGLRIPLLSYITMAGRVVTAISMCEPCRSTRFHIKDKTMVCNACYTEWNLDTLKGIKGGCLNYPPEVIPNTVQKDYTLIDEKIVLEWRPRV